MSGLNGRQNRYLGGIPPTEQKKPYQLGQIGQETAYQRRSARSADQLTLTIESYAKDLGIESSVFKSKTWKDLDIEYQELKYKQEIAKVSTEEEAKARAKEEKKLAVRRRRAKTVLTSPLGLQGGSVQQTVLGGQ